MAAFVRSWERETEVVGRMLDERQSATEIPDGEFFSSLLSFSWSNGSNLTTRLFFLLFLSFFVRSTRLQSSTTTSTSSSR